MIGIGRIKGKMFAAIEIALSYLLSMMRIERIIGYKLARKSRFTFNGGELTYFFHSYNNFGFTERMVEMPIIKQYLESGRYEHVLEIGNVTSHYYDYFKQSFVRKTVVDKFEKAFDVINKDINEYVPAQKFDFIFSVSTFEHMDADLGRNYAYRKGSSKLVSVAADNIKHVAENMVSENGKFVITAPLCYTPEWKETFYSGVFKACGFSRHKTYLFRRTSEITWEQVPVEVGINAAMDSYEPYRHYLSIVEFDK